MKIRTLEQFYDKVEEEKAWRRKELANLLTQVETSRSSHRTMVLRNAITLLYAHWEGLVKQITKYYLNYVHYQNHSLHELSPNIVALSLKKELNELEQSNKASLHTTFVKSYLDNLQTKANLPYDNGLYTGSNLNSERFLEILCGLGIEQSKYEGSFNLIDEVLLKNRNEIAHGNYVLVDEKRYKEVYNTMTKLMFNFFLLDILNLAATKGYLKVGFQEEMTINQ